MKKQSVNQRIKRKLQASVILLFAGALIIIGICAGNNTSKTQEQQKSFDDPRVGTQSKYDDLTKRITKTNVCPGITPVHIFREVNGVKYLHTTGGQLTGDGSILTCGHGFWDLPENRKVPWKFYYQILQPYEKKYHPISAIRTIDAVETNAVSASRDVIACIPGTAELINPLPAPTEASAETSIRFDYYKKYDSKLTVRSTVTGESFDVIGETKMTGGPGYFVLDCSTFQSQSGTIYVGKDNKTLYILSRSVLINAELKKVFGLSDSSKGVTLCSSVIIH